MHPLLAEKGRLGLYLAAWIPVSGLLGILVAVSAQVTWYQAAVLALPLGLVYAFVCLAAWYPCRAMPPGKTGLLVMTVSQGLAALFSSTLWLVMGSGWTYLLDRIPRLVGIRASFLEQLPLFFGVGVLLYLLAAAGHYLLVTLEASQRAESQNLELQVRTREAELRALEAQREQELAERELSLARSIQRRLLPPSEMEGIGYLLAARNLPAKFVAGDFYDVFRLPEAALGIAVADVAGKGVGASLIMASVKAMLPLIAADRSVVETLKELNRKLASELSPREFVALACARFSPHDGLLELANAGLPDPYLLRRGHPPRVIEVPGARLPLGVRLEVDYRSVQVSLQPSDRVLIVTDGLPEAVTSSGDPLGYDALLELLDGEQATPGGWLDGLLRRLQEVTVEQQADDVTALLLERAAP